MRTYVTKRLLLIVPTLFGVAAVVFVIMRVIPGDVALLILGGDSGQIDQKQLTAMRQQLGLDQPLLVQFGTWLWGILRLDFGNSLWTGQPVTHELLIRLPLSLQLALFATIVSVMLAIPLGMLAAVRQDTWVDYAVRVFSIGGLAVPGFWVGILTILGLVIFFGWGPPLELTPPWVDPWANFQMMVWPVVTVGYRYAAVTTRMTRSGYEVRVWPAWPGFPSEDMVADTASMNRHLQEYIDTMPEQYYWVHKRFKTRPAGEPPLY